MEECGSMVRPGGAGGSVSERVDLGGLVLAGERERLTLVSRVLEAL